MEKILKMREERARIVGQMRALVDKAEGEKRAMTTEEDEQYGRMNADVDRLGKEIRRLEDLHNLESSLETPAGASAPQNPGQEQRTILTQEEILESPEYREAFLDMCRNGAHASPESIRSLHVATDVKGGFWAPTEFDNTLRPILEVQNIMRTMVDVITSSSDKDIPFEEDYGEAFWTGEEEQFQDSDMEFSTKNISNHKLTALVKVSEELLYDTSFNLISYISNRFGKRYGKKEEAAIINGDGNKKPRGFILDALIGKITAAADAITSDELLEAYHSLSRVYRRSAKWLMADQTALVIRKLKNATTGDYMWQPGLKAGEPDVLLGKPVEISDDMPAFGTAGNKPIAFGDFKEYMLVDRKGSILQRLNELFALTGQVGFRGYKRLDGRLLRPDAIKMVQNKPA